MPVQKNPGLLMKELKWLRRDLPCRRIARWAIFVTLSFPLAASAQNLLVNPTFDTDLNGWENRFMHIDAFWDMEDADGDPGSGSVNLVKGDDGGAVIIVFQCVPVEPDIVYSFGGDFKLFTTDATAYQATFLLYPKSSSDCAGSPVGASASANVKMSGSWITTSSTINTPATAQTIDFRVIAENGSNEFVHIAADNIWLIPNDIFLNMVFEDSFE